MAAQHAETLSIFIKTDKATIVSNAISDRLTGVECEQGEEIDGWVELVLSAVPAYLAVAERMLTKTVLTTIASEDYNIQPTELLEDFLNSSTYQREKEVWTKLRSMNHGLFLETEIIPGVGMYIEAVMNTDTSQRKELQKHRNRIRKVGRELQRLVRALNDSKMYYQGIPPEVLQLLLNPYYKDYRNVMKAIKDVRIDGKDYSGFTPLNENLSSHLFVEMRKVLIYILLDLEYGS